MWTRFCLIFGSDSHGKHTTMPSRNVDKRTSKLTHRQNRGERQKGIKVERQEGRLAEWQTGRISGLNGAQAATVKACPATKGRGRSWTPTLGTRTAQRWQPCAPPGCSARNVTEMASWGGHLSWLIPEESVHRVECFLSATWVLLECRLITWLIEGLLEWVLVC